jgi:hypothetical protein
MTTPYELTFNDESIGELIADVMHNHMDMDMTPADYAPHIVAALRDNGLLADAALDVDGVRLEIARISALASAAFGDSFHFATVTIWGPQHRQRHAAVGVTLHIHHGSKSFTGASPAAAIADTERYIEEHAPARIEAEGWQILGVVRA